MTTALAKAGVLRAATGSVRGHSTQAIAPGINERHARAAEDTAAQRELFMNVLNSQATKRDAKQFIARFNRPKTSPNPSRDTHRQCGVNLGRLYAPPGRAIAESPQFVRDQVGGSTAESPAIGSSVALVCLKDAGTLDEETLDGLALTLAQLVRLDMRLVLVLDGMDMEEQLQRVSKAISRHSAEGARVVTGALDVDDDDRIAVGIPNLLHEPLRRGIVPILPPWAHSPSGRCIKASSVSSTMLALTRHLANQQLSLDRIILLDGAGGIPSRAREDGSHVFINLQQEFTNIKDELDEYKTSGRAKGTDFAHHSANLELMHNCLDLLPSASSALIVSPLEAASSAREAKSPSTGIGTRRQRNALIHNLLTNRPMVSSSLPTARVLRPQIPVPQAATLLKRGMPLTMTPPPDAVLGWERPPSGYTHLSLHQDPRIDWSRLVGLIEDSFRRKLDVEHYLQRIKGRVAGVIIAGDYEGGAILTWEQPPGTDEPDRLVPYLDKFVVAQSSQGSSGTADIVFQAMVRTCFPGGVCWRSRQVNPVNRWYFERSEGSWKIPNNTWTMFWTGSEMMDTHFHDCLSVCQSIEPSLH